MQTHPLDRPSPSTHIPVAASSSVLSSSVTSSLPPSSVSSSSTSSSSSAAKLRKHHRLNGAIPATLLAEYRGAVEALYSGGGGTNGGGGSATSQSHPLTQPAAQSLNLIRQAQSDRLFEGYPMVRIDLPPSFYQTTSHLPAVRRGSRDTLPNQHSYSPIRL